MKTKTTESPVGRYKITLKRRHLVNGEQCNCSLCPIALALKDRFPGLRVEVAGYTLVGNSVAKHTKKMDIFIDRFDRALTSRKSKFKLPTFCITFMLELR
jgi:hypothetical protein